MFPFLLILPISIVTKGELYDIWNTVNRISLINGVVGIDGLKVNTVRMLGGINKKVDGKKVPDLDLSGLIDPAHICHRFGTLFQNNVGDTRKIVRISNWVKT